MRHIHANRPVTRCEAQGELLLCKGRNGRDKTLLIDTPTRVEGEEGKLMFCHERYSLFILFFKKNRTVVLTRVRKQWGRKREERADHRLRNDQMALRDRGKEDFPLPTVR
jgi:hypothetical protein